MSIKRSISILTASIVGLASSIAITTPAKSESQYRFTCRQMGSVWTTVAQTPRGDRPYIQWTSDFGGFAGYSREDRCKQVSARLDSYVREQSPLYLTHGRHENGYPIICRTNFEGRGCSGNDMVYTIDPNGTQTAQDVLKQLLRLSGNDFKDPVPVFASSCRLYVNVRQHLQEQPSASFACSPR
ncbi:COP23 domain-containing protein [Aerosakkonema sp. BLCC-F183]|uniref:COP23 domain-containing protein n=1 Tax=Aerosakkonema sp. BLCC-F183 TaxID=3342834 RepID=UPI0035BA6C00